MIIFVKIVCMLLSNIFAMSYFDCLDDNNNYEHPNAVRITLILLMFTTGAIAVFLK